MNLQELEKAFNSFQTNISLSFVDFQNKTNEKISSVHDEIDKTKQNIQKLRTIGMKLAERITELENKEKARQREPTTPPESVKLADLPIKNKEHGILYLFKKIIGE